MLLPAKLARVSIYYDQAKSFFIHSYWAYTDIHTCVLYFNNSPSAVAYMYVLINKE